MLLLVMCLSALFSCTISQVHGHEPKPVLCARNLENENYVIYEGLNVTHSFTLDIKFMHDI